MAQFPPELPHDPSKPDSKPEGIFFTSESGEKEEHNPIHTLTLAVDTFVIARLLFRGRLDFRVNYSARYAPTRPNRPYMGD